MNYIQTHRVLTAEKADQIHQTLKALPEEQWVIAETLGTKDDRLQLGLARTSETLREGHDFDELDWLRVAVAHAMADYRAEMFLRHPALAINGLCEWEPTFMSMPTIQRYRPGQFYQWHVDTVHLNASVEGEGPGQPAERAVSSILYLNDDFEDGGTQFAEDETYKPQPGESLFFPSNHWFPHRGRTVTSGVKYVVVTWFMRHTHHV